VIIIGLAGLLLYAWDSLGMRSLYNGAPGERHRHRSGGRPCRGQRPEVALMNSRRRNRQHGLTLISTASTTLAAATRRATLRENAAFALDCIEQEWRDAEPNTLRFRTAAGAQALVGANQVDDMQLGARRARFAARASLEWARYRITQTVACAANVLNLGVNAGALRGFRVTVTCSSTPHDDGGVSRISYVINSFAHYGGFGAPDYVSSRSIEILVR
jgi:hypothetical protein